VVLPGQHHTRTGIPVRVTQGGVGGVARPAPHPHRDPGAGDRHPDDDLWQVIAVVLGLAIGAEPRLGRAVAVGGVSQRGAALVSHHGGVGVVEFEVGRGRVEEQQVDFKIEQGRDLPEDLLLQGAFDLQQPVHGPVAGIVAGLWQAVDVHVVFNPAGGGELGGGGQGAVGDQGEQHPLHPRIPAAAREEPADHLVDAQPVPHAVQHVRAAKRPGLEEGQLGAGGHPQRRGGVQQPGQRSDQPFDRGRVHLVGPAEAVEDLRAGRLRRRVPFVVDQLQVRHLRAVLVPPPHLPQEHVPDTISIDTG
jgi:hypothetical protein